METWTKGAAEKISAMLKASVCEAPPAESAAWRLCERRREIQKVFQPAVPKENDHIYCREERQAEDPTAAAAGDAESETEPDAATWEETNSGSVSALKVVPSVPGPEPASNLLEGDIVPEDSSSSDTSPKIKTKAAAAAAAGSFKCPSCEKTFARKCLMDRHFLIHSKPHLCSECGKRFAVPRALIAHSRKHTGEKLYRCADCGTEFAYKSTFRRHVRKHSAEKPNTHMCALCERHFTGQREFQRHRCGALKRTFVCSLCPETFECRQSLADHEDLHSGERDFVCEMCGEKFLSSSSLATHRVTHTQKENCCEALGLGCSDLSVLKNHLSKHTGEKLFTCEVCGKGCSHQSALKHHMLTHTRERPYVCETCGKRCGHASALQNHMRIHTGRKPGQKTVCNVCGKKISSSGKLKFHMRVHTGERPYACDQCEKKFSTPGNLKTHMVTHSGEKMYGCNICGRRFTQGSSLKTHRRLHLGETPFHCSACGKGFEHRGEYKRHQMDHLPAEGRDNEAEKTAII
ncbi:uncharacterized protein PAE49_000372 isoform 2-T2 [Odontesthes bonariensis]